MNTHSTGRLALARQIAPAYAVQDRIEVVFVHGSVGRGWADEYSDIEMACIWSGQPSPEVARAVTASLGANDWEWGNYNEARQAWGEQFRYKGMEVEFGHWTRETIDTIIYDVVERYDTTQHGLMFHKQATVSVLQHGIVLYGEEWMHRIGLLTACCQGGSVSRRIFLVLLDEEGILRGLANSNVLRD